jgi:hypothetical protein
LVGLGLGQLLTNLTMEDLGISKTLGVTPAKPGGFLLDH